MHVDLHWQSDDESVAVDAWNHLHLKGAREVEGTVIRVTRLHPTGSDARELWLFWRSVYEASAAASFIDLEQVK